ncbi:MAG TPA: response regulator [Tepidisphaeraceae bacterium]|jgi:DNA-binding response OmpR family regulator|nr:response regulator [Tepidisphaeraceae bacterium]
MSSSLQSANQPSDSSKPDVLVVEDDATVNKLVCRCVQMAGFAVRSALTGTAALRAAEERAPAIVLLDLMLPDTTGFDVCEAIKRNEKTRDAVVVMVTALDDDESRSRGLACGAAEYLVKPFHPTQLIETVQRYAAGM